MHLIGEMNHIEEIDNTCDVPEFHEDGYFSEFLHWMRDALDESELGHYKNEKHRQMLFRKDSFECLREAPDWLGSREPKLLRRNSYESFKNALEGGSIKEEHEEENVVEINDDNNDDDVVCVEESKTLNRRNTNQPQTTSITIFNKYVETVQNNQGEIQCDCSGILSRPCYEEWLATRAFRPRFPEERFRKSIVAHLTCQDARSSPFSPEVERELLILLRRPQIWPCFYGRNDDSGRPIQIGAKGLRCSGFWESGGKRKRCATYPSDSKAMMSNDRRRLRLHHSGPAMY